jgi:glutamate carboxypeptidase
MKKLFLALCFLTAFSTVNAQKLSNTEKKIIAYVNQQLPETTDLLIKTVNINSGTLNIEGVKKVGAIYSAELEKAGLKSEWISLPDSLHRAGHLVATKKGTKGKRLFIIGHLDTVFEPDMPPNPWQMLNDSTATGQGVTDMKGGDVVVIAALQALKKLGLLDDASLTVYFTGDEERAGTPISISRKDFIERAQQCDVALGFETAVGLNTIATARRGASSWELNVTAKTGHSQGIFTNNSGYGAIYEASRILNDFRLQLSTEKYLTFNPGLIVGGSEIHYNADKATGDVIGKTNIISPEVTVIGDLRFLTEAQKEAAREKMKAIVANNLNGTTAAVSFTDGIPSMAPTEGNNRLLAVVDGVSQAIGIGKTIGGDPGSRGAGDISYIAKYVDCIDGLGSSGKGAHAVGETINLKEFPYLIQRAAVLIYRLTR